MTGFDWFLLGYWSLGVVINILIIGRPRVPLTPPLALFSVSIYAALAAGLIISRT